MPEQSIPNTAPLTPLGIVLIVLGVLSIAAPAVAGAAVVMIIGGVLLVAGAVQIGSGWRSETGAGRWPPVILGAIVMLGGILLLTEPLVGMKVLALLLAVFFIVEGVWKIVTSFRYRPASGWAFVLVSGVLALLLGLLIWSQWPVSGRWAVGILVGVDLLVTGIAMLVLASTLRGREPTSQPSHGDE